MPSPYLQKGSKSLQRLDLISSGSEDPALLAALPLSCITLLAAARDLLTHRLSTPPELRRQRTLEQGREIRPRHHRRGGRMVRGGAVLGAAGCVVSRVASVPSQRWPAETPPGIVHCALAAESPPAENHVRGTSRITWSNLLTGLKKLWPNIASEPEFSAFPPKQCCGLRTKFYFLFLSSTLGSWVPQIYCPEWQHFLKPYEQRASQQYRQSLASLGGVQGATHLQTPTAPTNRKPGESNQFPGGILKDTL